ncbi:MAG TPA: TolC family protein [Bryobacteraceae bacterium]|jgi:outer membrane protein TolC|nr:TolC family protein [Bryobacteraceae bacterium]
MELRNLFRSLRGSGRPAAWPALALSLLLSPAVFSQTSSFPKANYFRQVFEQSHTQVDLRDPVKLKDFVVDGKIELSLKNYLELVMANNTDIQVTFLSVETPRNNITSAYGVWDPVALASFSTTRSTAVATNPSQSQDASLGSTSKSLSQPLSLSYAQTLDTGTSYVVSFGGAKYSFNNSYSSYNPSISSDMSFAVTQSLIRNRGRFVNRIPLMEAQSTYKRAGFTLRSNLLGWVNNAESIYWRVVSARENVRVQEKARDTAKSNLDFVQKQLDLGAVSPLDIYNPQGQLAAQELALSQARFALQQAEDALRHQIGVDLDPDLRKLGVEVTEPVDISTVGMDFNADNEVQKALANNPSVKAATQSLDIDDLGIQGAHNNLLPNLTFTASYGGAGQGGIYTSSGAALLGGGPAIVVPGGLADALGQMFGLNNPTYMGSLNLTLPIRSRTASMNLANALVNKKLDALNLRNVEQNTRLSVLTAVSNVNGAIESLGLAKTQEDLQHKNYDAEVEKYTLGTDNNQNVVIALQNWVVAQSAVVTAQVNLRTSILNLYTQTGELLDQRGIVVN